MRKIDCSHLETAKIPVYYPVVFHLFSALYLCASTAVDYSYFHIGFLSSSRSTIFALCVMEKLNIYFILYGYSCDTAYFACRFKSFEMSPTSLEI